MPFKFTSVSVFPDRARGNYYVNWDGQGFGSFKFAIENAPNSDGPWTPVDDKFYAAGPIKVTPKEKNLSLTYTTWFRIKAIEGTTVTAVSNPFDCNLQVTRQEYLYWKEMVRRWNLELRKFGGDPAIVLRLKTYGEPADNVHPILGKPIGTEDSSGKGQKFKGGYHTPVAVFGAYGDSSEKKSSVEQHGTSEVHKIKIWSMPFPLLNTNDIWVDILTNNRYRIESNELIEFRGLIVKQIMSASKLPITDPAYKFSLEPVITL